MIDRARLAVGHDNGPADQLLLGSMQFGEDVHGALVAGARADLAPSLNARAWPWDVREWPNVWTGVGGRIARYIVSGWALIWL
jgi:hypothetical protein